MLEDLKKLALEAIKIQKKIKAETKKLREIKDHLIEKSKNRNSSYTIKVEDGSIRIIKYKRLIYYKLNERGFNKLDNQTKNDLLKKKLLKVKFSVNYDTYQDASDKNLIPNNLKDLVEKKDRKPFSVSVLVSKKEEEILNKIENNDSLEEVDDEHDEVIEDILLNVFPPDSEHFTDDDPKDLKEIEKQEKGLELKDEEDEEEIKN